MHSGPRPKLCQGPGGNSVGSSSSASFRSRSPQDQGCQQTIALVCTAQLSCICMLSHAWFLGTLDVYGELHCEICGNCNYVDIGLPWKTNIKDSAMLHWWGWWLSSEVVETYFQGKNKTFTEYKAFALILLYCFGSVVCVFHLAHQTLYAAFRSLKVMLCFGQLWGASLQS